eukprot:TRINITY_DN1592_c0_g2_i2.p1 TRINITY_DN1592_c0_g2~~TRINITY_DN1592_c0_g2_i2.p1  ORF type:complete len:416 (-),score=67.95 TRINITY_DN1592_c0_g2_i2:283-1530(-)
MTRAASNVCCHYCRISKNRGRKTVQYITCKSCRNSYCSSCLTSHLRMEIAEIENNEEWKCNCCLGTCCCNYSVCPVESVLHKHCFTYRRTASRKSKTGVVPVSAVPQQKIQKNRISDVRQKRHKFHVSTSLKRSEFVEFVDSPPSSPNEDLMNLEHRTKARRKSHPLPTSTSAPANPYLLIQCNGGSVKPPFPINAQQLYHHLYHINETKNNLNNMNQSNNVVSNSILQPINIPTTPTTSSSSSSSPSMSLLYMTKNIPSLPLSSSNQSIVGPSVQVIDEEDSFLEHVSHTPSPEPDNEEFVHQDDFSQLNDFDDHHYESDQTEHHIRFHGHYSIKQDEDQHYHNQIFFPTNHDSNQCSTISNHHSDSHLKENDASFDHHQQRHDEKDNLSWESNPLVTEFLCGRMNGVADELVW